MPTSESNITPVTSTVKDGKSKSSTMYNETNHTSFSWLGLQSCSTISCWGQVRCKRDEIIIHRPQRECTQASHPSPPRLLRTHSSLQRLRRCMSSFLASLVPKSMVTACSPWTSDSAQLLPLAMQLVPRAPVNAYVLPASGLF